jgi:hypothetical protein
MFEAYPRFRFLTALCGATLLFSTMSFTFAQDGISRVPNVPLEDLPDLSTVGSNSSYQSGSYLGPASLKVGTEGLTVDLSSAGLNLDGVPVVWGDIAQVSPEESSGESVLESLGMSEGREPALESLGMEEGADPALQQLAMAEPGSILTSLALSEAAASSSIIPLIVGGTAVAAGLGQAVSSLVRSDPDDDIPVPASP